MEGRISLSNHDNICGNKVQNTTGSLHLQGTVYILLYLLLQPLQSILPKMAYMKPYLDVTYYTSPGPIFHVDSESEVIISILDLCHVLWADLW